jgi:release factor glutamine methyltransferase
LFGGEDGMAVLRRIVAGAPARLVPGGLLAVEIGASQGEAVSALIAAEGGAWGARRVVRDLTGRDRVVLAETAMEGEHG